MRHADRSAVLRPLTGLATRVGLATLVGLALLLGGSSASAVTEEETSGLPADIEAMRAPLDHTTIRVSAGGVREWDGSISGVEGRTFYAIPRIYGSHFNDPPTLDDTSAHTCTTDQTGTCTMVVPDQIDLSGQHGYWITQAAGTSETWQRIDRIATGHMDGAKTPRPYMFHTGNVSWMYHVHEVPASSSVRIDRSLLRPASDDRLGSHWMNRTVNPPLPSTCGLDVAMVFDTSGSMSSADMTDMKDAASALVGPDGLSGTAATVSMYRFAGTAERMAAGGEFNLAQAEHVTAVRDAVNSLPTSGSGWGNWDHAFRMVAQDGPVDLVLFFTGGDPTTFGTGSHSNPTVNLEQVEHAVASANAVKVQAGQGGGGARVVGVGTGMTGNAHLNLQAVTGPDEGEDYIAVDDVPQLASELAQVLAENCGGSLTVTKQIVDTEGVVVDDSAGGWEFTATADEDVLMDNGTPTDTLTAVTDETTGAVTFDLVAGEDPATHPVTITETQQEGFALVPQDGNNATCRADGENVDVTDDGELGFTVPVTTGVEVNCTVHNTMVPDHEDLLVHTDVDHSLDRTYLWTIDKVADETVVTADPLTQLAAFDYTVTATPVLPPNGWTDSEWTMAGSVTVENPNPSLDISADIAVATDVGGGASCAVTDGAAVLVPAGETVQRDYACTFTAQPADAGTVTATATWVDTAPTPTTSASGTADVTVDGWAVSPVNDVVTIMESQDGPADPTNPVELGTATWNDSGTPTTFTYSLQHAGNPGACLDHTTTAWIQQTLQSVDELVTACMGAAPVVTATAGASYDRLYQWTVDKSVDETDVETDGQGRATYTYTVEATPAGFTDSNWEMAGQIDVANPGTNPDGDITVDVVVTSDVGGMCTIAGGSGITVAPGATGNLDYICTFTAEPDYVGENTVTVSWTGSEGAEEMIARAVPVTFEVGVITDRTVDVLDDKSDPAEAVLLGESVWDDASTHTFTYDLIHQGVGGQCVDFTNTGWLDLEAGRGPEDSTSVELCLEATLPQIEVLLTSVEQRPNPTWDLTYEVVVDNSGSNFPAFYDLAATPGFAEGVTILSQSVLDVTDPDAPTDISWDGVSPIVTGAELAAGAMHRYELSINARVAAGIPAGNLDCNPAEGAGYGYFLSVSLTAGAEVIEAQSCGDITATIVPTVTKAVADGSPVQAQDGTWTIDYDIVVATPAGNTLPTIYELSDVLGYGEGINVLSAEVATGDAATPQPLASWTGLAADTAVTDGEVVLPAGLAHTYTVRVQAEVGDASTEAAQCYAGEMSEPGGFLNTVVLATDTIERTADACAEPAAASAGEGDTPSGPGGPSDPSAPPVSADSDPPNGPASVVERGLHAAPPALQATGVALGGAVLLALVLTAGGLGLVLRQRAPDRADRPMRSGRAPRARSRYSS